MNGDKPTSQSDPQPAPAGQWQYKPSSVADQASQPQPNGGTVEAVNTSAVEFEWTGSEFIAHSKGVGWYAAYCAAGVLATTAGYFITKDILATTMVGALAIITGVAASRSPRTLTYRIMPSGVFIGRKFYAFSEFKSFSVIDEGAFSSVAFWPLKPFSFSVGVYYDPQQEDQIISTLAKHLPLQEHRVDVLERFMRRIRF